VWTKLITVVELAAFLRAAAKVWSDDERSEFVDYVAANPEAGDVIPETGGLRKVRWGAKAWASVAAWGSSIIFMISKCRFL
jgi:hypothetical protein